VNWKSLTMSTAPAAGAPERRLARSPAARCLASPSDAVRSSRSLLSVASAAAVNIRLPRTTRRAPSVMVDEREYTGAVGRSRERGRSGSRGRRCVAGDREEDRRCRPTSREDARLELHARLDRQSTPGSPGRPDSSSSWYNTSRRERCRRRSTRRWRPDVARNAVSVAAQGPRADARSVSVDVASRRRDAGGLPSGSRG
jgi:hypothetical protein